MTDWGPSSMWYYCSVHKTNVVRVGAVDDAQLLRFHRHLYKTRCVFEKVQREGM